MSTVLPSASQRIDAVDDDYIPGDLDGAPEPAPQPPIENRAADASLMPPVLVLATTANAPLPRWSLSWIAHLLGLDVYGHATMSDAARIEMSAAAVILVVIFGFDSVAWCLLFYFVVNAGSLDLNVARIMLAIGGLLPATALLLYERGFMTADTKSRGWRRLIFPTALRIGIIALAAWITAQPIEIIAFGRRIEQRVHDERTRQDIVSRYVDLNEQLENRGQAGVGAVLADTAKADLEQTKQSLENLNHSKGEETTKLRQLQRERDAAKANRDRVYLQLQRLQPPGPDADSTPAARDAYLEVKRRYDRAEANYRSRSSAVIAGQDRVDGLTADVDRATKERDRLEQRMVSGLTAKAGEVEVQRLRRWARRLRSSPPGRDYRDAETNLEFRFVDYDFLEKLRIIDDLRKARPVRWPGATPAIRARLASEYGMYDDADQVTLDVDAATASRTYWSIFGVAIIIPFMSLLFKIIMPAHLAYYYSNNWQASQGHPWALTLKSASKAGKGRATWKSND